MGKGLLTFLKPLSVKRPVDHSGGPDLGAVSAHFAERALPQPHVDLCQLSLLSFNTEETASQALSSVRFQRGKVRSACLFEVL